jgi:DMSO/TMAO reductase YedYZ heme-binding membrane subunit
VKNWRKVHYLSFLFYILFMVHAILAGTDSTEWWMITIYAISGITVVGLILLRIFGKKYFINSVRAKAKTIPTANSTPTQNQNSELTPEAVNS